MFLCEGKSAHRRTAVSRTFNDILRILAGRRIDTSRSACNHIQRVTQDIAQDDAQHLCRGARHSKTPAFTADNRLRMVLISTISAPHPSSCCVISCNSSKGIQGFSSRALPPPDRRNTTVSCAVNPCTRSSAACVPRQEPSSGTGCPPSKQRIWAIGPLYAHTL